MTYKYELEVDGGVQTFTGNSKGEWDSSDGKEVSCATADADSVLEGETEVRTCTTCLETPQLGEFDHFEVTPGENGRGYSPSFSTYGFGSWTCLTCETEYRIDLTFDESY